MKVSELSGAALDWAVAKCEGFPIERKQYSDPDDWVWYYNGLSYYPSEEWAQGGPIIERGGDCIGVEPRHQTNRYGSSVQGRLRDCRRHAESEG